MRLYFSFVTLATVAYGDYTPAGDVGHTTGDR
jgi:Ion channel